MKIQMYRVQMTHDGGVLAWRVIGSVFLLSPYMEFWACPYGLRFRFQNSNVPWSLARLLYPRCTGKQYFRALTWDKWSYPQLL